MAATVKPGSPPPADVEGPRTMGGGRYRIDGVLGAGAHGTVWAAYDTVLERDVALKELHEGSTLALSEAKAIAAVPHANVVRLHAIETPLDGSSAFLVMERVVGTTMEALIEDARPSLREALRLLRHAAAGIDAIHAVGLVHGDVKPSNLLVDGAGVVKVADLGLVPRFAVMQQGEILGTPRYIAPERAAGLAPDALAPRGDVYSFGVVAMELLTGKLPFDSPTATAAVAAHLFQRPRAPSSVSGLATAFDEPILRALAKKPADRPASCADLVYALERAAFGADHDGRPLQLLVADDDDDLRGLLDHALAASLPGAVIRTARDGHEALEMARREPPTIALLDLSMPGLGGIALVAAMREVAPEAAILVITGHGSGREWTEARQLGAQRFLVKPIDLDELARAVRDVVDRRGRLAAA